ncbi:hypothetical protein Rsub_04624 [Raphidocelis subcapitata]|uniref:Uncharacterized protein n=1 Tax=Raphidocelis subcapitata TaxID=307507 RepID=A0A2V0P3U5_9CHLO|nr:hypothetical protein Rsub_04624 [Raphidocelis subcapitata]|eukprot:GBF92520.1 hypothetical protein Rsub_04624 [Raphidocelis subcapitata]
MARIGALVLLAVALAAAGPAARAARPPSGSGADTGPHTLRAAAAAPPRAPSAGWMWPSSWASALWPWAPRAGVAEAEEDECETGDIRKFGLKLLREMPFAGLFEDLKDVTKFEASGMTSARGKLWIVFDNLHAIGRIDEHFQFRSGDNILLGHVGEDSQFEGLAYDEQTGHFYVVEEVVEQGDTHLHPVAQEVEMDERTHAYRIIERCPIHYQLSHANKGFEGIHYFRDPRDPRRELLMGLCEGNFCKGGRRGRESGNGRLVVSEFYKNASGCGWDVVKVVDIPRSAFFMDYSGLDVRDSKIAITSQEDSALWIGTFDFEALEFIEPDSERVYHFPRDNHCQMIFCNVEGIAWLDDSRFIIASDKAKSTQPYRCITHDQSIGIFALPVAPDDAAPPSPTGGAAAKGGGDDEAE